MESSKQRSFSECNFLIVGTVRNCEKTIINEVNRLNDIFKKANKASWLIVESDSVDGTKESLKNLKLKLPYFDFISLGRLADNYPERARRIAFCRDVYVKEIRSRLEYSDVNYVVVADLDGMCSDLTYKSVLTCWAKSNWTACFANQPKGYYDLWALRHDYWNPRDPFITFKKLHNLGINAAKAYKTAVIDKILKIDIASTWVPVRSAFGGLGIYKYEAFIKSDYSVKGEYPDKTCEHVTFNKKLGKSISDCNLYINPSLVNINRSGHVFQLKLKYFLLKFFGYSLFKKLKHFKLK